MNSSDDAIRLLEARNKALENELSLEKNERLKLERENAELTAECENCGVDRLELERTIIWLKQGYGKEVHDCEAVLAEALSYTYEEKYGWVIGDHTITTLAMEVRRKIQELTDALYSGDDQWT